MSEEEKWVNRLPHRTWKYPIYPFKPVAPMPPNTLTNADGTPYSAGHDEKSLGQIAYEAFVNNGAYRELLYRIVGYRLDASSWEQLSSVEQRVWQQTAEAVLEEIKSQ